MTRIALTEEQRNRLKFLRKDFNQSPEEIRRNPNMRKPNGDMHQLKVNDLNEIISMRSSHSKSNFEMLNSPKFTNRQTESNRESPQSGDQTLGRSCGCHRRLRDCEAIGQTEVAR